MRRVGRVIVGEAIALFAFTALFFWQAATSSSLISYKDPVGDRLSWIFLGVLTLGGGLACLVARLLFWRFKTWERQILILETIALFVLTALGYWQGDLFDHFGSVLVALMAFGGAMALIIASLILWLSNIISVFGELKRAKGKKMYFPFAVLIVLFTPGLTSAQNRADYCHVYVIDMTASKAVADNYPTGNAQEDVKLLAGAITIVGRFSPKIAEEILTTKTYQLPGTDRVITAGVFYTDEMMYSSLSKTQESMLVGIAVSTKAQEDIFEAKNSSVAEITYSAHTDTVRVKTRLSVQRRQYLVGMECRCNREFDEMDPKREK